MKVTFAIWKDQENSQARYKELVGFFEGTYEEADTLVEKMNDTDPDTKDSNYRRGYCGYWRQEVTKITNKNFAEFVTC